MLDDILHQPRITSHNELVVIVISVITITEIMRLINNNKVI